MAVTAYHGTPHAFDRFKVPASGLHFGTEEQAVHACTLKMARLPPQQFATLIPDCNGWRGRLMKVRLNVQSVKRVNDARTPSAWARAIKKARQEGYDALVYCNAYEGRGEADSFVVFSADQVEVINPYLNNPTTEDSAIQNPLFQFR